MSNLFQYNRIKRLKLGGLNSTIQIKFNYMLFPSKSKNKKARQTKQNKTRRIKELSQIYCVKANKRECILLKSVTKYQILRQINHHRKITHFIEKLYIQNEDIKGINLYMSTQLQNIQSKSYAIKLYKEKLERKKKMQL